MSYEVMNKTPKRVDGQIVETTIDIRQNDPYTLITRTIEGDHTNTNDKKAIEIVLEVVNEETTPKSEMKANIKELQKQVTEQQEVIQNQSENIQQVLKSNQMLSNAFEELTFVVLDEVLPQLVKNDVIDATPIEDIAEENKEESDVIPAIPIEDTAQPIEDDEDAIPAKVIEDVAQPIEEEGVVE